MRWPLAVVLFALPYSALRAQAPVLDARTKADILAVRETAWRAWFAGDRAALAPILPENFVGLSWGEGPWSNRDAALAASAEFVAGGGKLTVLEFPRTEFQVLGDVVILYSEYHVEFTTGGQPVSQTGRATEVFRRQDGKWVHPAWHLDSGR